MRIKQELDYPYLTAVYNCESDMCVHPVKANAEAIASLILNVGCDSDVIFYSPDGNEVAASCCDIKIERCADEAFFNGLISVFDEMKRTGIISEAYCEEPEIDPGEWAEQYDRYYIPPNDVGYRGPEYF